MAHPRIWKKNIPVDAEFNGKSFGHKLTNFRKEFSDPQSRILGSLTLPSILTFTYSKPINLKNKIRSFERPKNSAQKHIETIFSQYI